MPCPHAALIVDSNPKGLESLVYGFQEAGWRITACPTPETASLLVKASGAEIVVIASRTDHDKAHTLVRQLRSREAFRTLPVLLLGPEGLRQSTRQHGEVDFLPLPTYVRDVLTASQLLVSLGATPSPKPGEEPAFEDAIAAQGTLSIVRAMMGLARSGSLHLVRKGRHGEILFHEGELTAAQVGPLQAMAAVQHLLVWNDGRLELRLRPVARRGQFHQSTREFLAEFDRFQRDYTHAIKDIGPPDTVYLVNQDRLHASPGDVPAEVTPVVRLCDGQRALFDVIDESPFRVLDTIRILGRLVELSILNRRDPKPADEAGDRTLLDEFWNTARLTGETETGGPTESKTRPQRQTLEIGRPASLTSQSSAELPVAPIMPAGPAGIEAERATAQSAAAESKAAAVERRLTPALGLSGLPRRQSPAPGVPVLKPATASPAQTSGAFELRKDGRQTQQSMRTAEPRRSVVIDTELVNVVAAASATPPNAATSRPTNMPTMQDSPGSRVTGEMKAVPSGRSRAQAKIGSVSSFQIDPSLAVAIDAQTKPDPPRQDLPSPETKHGVHRPSGGFSPVESDFFEREAELYKFEQSESFADLDDGKAHRGGSGKPSTGPSKPK